MPKKSTAPPFPNWAPSWHQMDIERYAPFSPFGAKKILPLPIAEVRPTIRLMRGDRQSNFYLRTRIIFDHLLLFFIEGEGQIVIEKTESEIQRRQLFIVPPFTPHSLLMKGIHTFLSIHFDWKPQFPPQHRLSGRQPYQIRLALNSQLPGSLILTASDPLVGQIQLIDEIWRKGTEASHLRADAVLFAVLSTLLERVQPKDSAAAQQNAHVEQKRIEMAIALMEKNLAEDLTPEMMAQAAGLSSSHFSRLFRKWTGRSPMEHLLQLRIRKAKELLGDVHLTIKEVANLSGFKDPSYFSKIFMRLDGLPPSQYRDMVLAQFKS